jgi:hypothetical protein
MIDIKVPVNPKRRKQERQFGSMSARSQQSPIQGTIGQRPHFAMLRQGETSAFFSCGKTLAYA